MASISQDRATPLSLSYITIYPLSFLQYRVSQAYLCRRSIAMTHTRTGHGIYPTRGCVITPTSRWEGAIYPFLSPSCNSKAGIMVRTIFCLPRLPFTPFGQAGCMPSQSRMPHYHRNQSPPPPSLRHPLSPTRQHIQHMQSTLSIY
jgi:hypothetical protein